MESGYNWDTTGGFKACGLVGTQSEISVNVLRTRPLIPFRCSALTLGWRAQRQQRHLPSIRSPGTCIMCLGTAPSS